MSEQLVILSATVALLMQIKILGIVLDQKLNYKAHITQASQKGVNSALALKRLRNLCPKTVQRIVQAKVTLFIDYASPIWSLNLSIAPVNKLNIFQKIRGQAIIGVFLIVTSIVIKSEAILKMPSMHHHNQQLQSGL